MSCAARYSETTSLEFILNPFKFFFTNYVAKIAPHSPPNIHHLESLFRRPTILRVERSNSSLTRCIPTLAFTRWLHTHTAYLEASALQNSRYVPALFAIALSFLTHGHAFGLHVFASVTCLSTAVACAARRRTSMLFVHVRELLFHCDSHRLRNRCAALHASLSSHAFPASPL